MTLKKTHGDIVIQIRRNFIGDGSPKGFVASERKKLRW